MRKPGEKGGLFLIDLIKSRAVGFKKVARKLEQAGKCLHRVMNVK